MGFEGTSLWAGIISGGLSQMQATKALNSGQICKNDYAVHTTKNVTGAVGVIAGIEYGAVLGSALIPGVGAAVGSIIGGLVGDRLGKYVGHQAGHLVFNRGQEVAPLMSSLVPSPASFGDETTASTAGEESVHYH